LGRKQDLQQIPTATTSLLNQYSNQQTVYNKQTERIGKNRKQEIEDKLKQQFEEKVHDCPRYKAWLALVYKYSSQFRNKNNSDKLIVQTVLQKGNNKEICNPTHSQINTNLKDFERHNQVNKAKNTKRKKYNRHGISR
jgi:hypothetical protein